MNERYLRRAVPVGAIFSDLRKADEHDCVTAAVGCGWTWPRRKELDDLGYSAEEVASMALDGFRVSDREGWTKAPPNRAPNMLRHDWNRGGWCRACEVNCGDHVVGKPCPGKPDPAPMQAPRIEIADGDQVTYPPAGGGYLESTHEGMGGRLVGEVRLAAWFWDEENDCYTTENTGKPAVLPIRAADLHKVPT